MDTLDGALNPQIQGILSGAFAGMQAAGPSRMPTSLGQVIGASGQAGMGAWNQAQNQNRQFAQTQAMIDLEKQKTAMAGMQVLQAQYQNAIKNWALGGGKGPPPAFPTMGGLGSSPPLGMPQGGQQGAPMPQGALAQASGAPTGALSAPDAGPLDSLQPWRKQVALLDMAGLPEFGKAIDKQNEPVNVQGVGMMVRDQNDPNRFVFAPGQIEGMTALERAKQGVTNDNTLVPRKDPTTGQPYNISKTEEIRLAQPGNALENLPADQATLIRNDMAKNGIQNANIAMSTANGPVRGNTSIIPGQRFTGPTAQRETYNTKAGGDFADYEKGLNGRVQEGQNLMMRIEESQKALQNFRAGGGAETYGAIAKTAQALGAPQSLVDKIAGGDLSAMQEFSKLSVQQAMEQLKQSMGGAGRIAQAEFKVFQANNPNIETDPRATQKVFDFARKVYERDRQEQQFVADYKKDPNADLSNAQNAWASESEKRGNVGKTSPPKKGDVVKGWEFLGGDPASRMSWRQK